MPENTFHFKLIGVLVACLIFVITRVLWPQQVFAFTDQLTQHESS